MGYTRCAWRVEKGKVMLYVNPEDDKNEKVQKNTGKEMSVDRQTELGWCLWPEEE